MQKFFQKKSHRFHLFWISACVALFGSLCVTIPAFAYYAPGETLNPSCAPTDAGCAIVTSSSTLSGDILPSAANTYSLGSAANPWKDLYVSSNSIYIAGISLSVSSSSALQWGGAGGIESSNASATSTIAGNLTVGGTTSLAGLVLVSSVPTSTANTLYNNGGTLYWNGQSISTSTGLTVGNFATSSISQWINDAGYITSTPAETDPIWNAASSSYLTILGASSTYLTITSASNNYVSTSSLASQLPNYLLVTSSTGSNLVWNGTALGVTTTPSFDALTVTGTTTLGTTTASALVLSSGGIQFADGSEQASAAVAGGTTSSIQFNGGNGFSGGSQYVIDSSDSNASKMKVVSPNGSEVTQMTVDQAGNTGSLYTSAPTLELWAGGSKQASINTSNAAFENGLVVDGASILATTTVTGLTATANGIELVSSTPVTTSLRLYNQGGQLYWNGQNISTQAYGSSTYLTIAAASSTYYLASNPNGYITTSTGLTIANFATSSILQWNNDAHYTTTTIPSVLNSLSASGLLTYNSSTGVFGYSSSSLNLGSASHYAVGDFLSSTTAYVATTSGNWTGTWQGVNSSTFYLASNPNGYISTSTGLTVSNFATSSISQWNNDVGYATSGAVAMKASNALLISAGGVLSGGGDLTANRTISLATSTLYNFFSGSGAITYSTSTGAFSFTNPGYISTSTGLTITNFATNTISQWNNDAGYLASSAASSTYLTIASAGNNYVVTSTLANYYTTSTANTRFVATSTLANYLLISSSTGLNLVWNGTALGVTSTPSFSALTLTSFTPSTTANALYNTGGSLYWSGTALALSSTSNSLVTLAVSGTSTLSKIVLSSASSSITGSGGINFSKGTLYLDTVNSRVGIGTVTPAAGLQASSSLIILGTGEGGTPGNLTIRGAMASGTNAIGADITFDASNGTGSGGSGNFIFRTSGPSIPVSPAVVATTSVFTGNVNTYTLGYTVPSGINRLLIVEAAFSYSGISVSSMTYGGQSMVGPGTSSCGITNTNGVRSELWYLVNPPAGTNNVIVNTGSSYGSFYISAVSLTGVNQSVGVTCGTAIGSSVAVTASTVSTSGDLVLDFAATNQNPTMTPGSSQTSIASQGNSSVSYGSSFVVATSTTTGMSWTLLPSENWAEVVADIKSATAAGSASTLAERMRITPSGNVGIGTATPAVPLQVFGDIRMGNAATNGCIQNFAGTGLAGACASDERLKTNITPIENVLSKVSELQPVTFSWNDLAAQTLGDHTDTLNYGLVAQQVAPIFPDMVTTTASGYLSVDYSMLPMLTLQGLREVSMLASSTAPTSTVSASGTIEKTFVGSVFDHLASWFASAANGIKDFYASIIHANQLCLKKSDGTEACVNGDELAALIANRNSGGGTASNSGSSSTLSTIAPSEDVSSTTDIPDAASSTDSVATTTIASSSEVASLPDVSSSEVVAAPSADASSSSE